MIGVAGCGRIGTSLLEALLEAGAHAAGFDILTQSHAVITTDIEQFASSLRTLFIVVGDASDVEALLFDTQALLRHASELQQIVLCTSVSQGYVHSVRDRISNDIQIVDAAIVGSVRDAENRMLTFLLGGSDDDIDEVIPLLSMIGKSFYRVGDLGMGMQVNGYSAMMSACQTAMTHLALDWGRTAGLQDTQLLDILVNNSNPLTQDIVVNIREGYTQDNQIGMQVRNLAAAIENAPRPGDVAIPQSVLNYLRNLKPQS
ncbi:MAG: NAD(P)-binding domain-containing protein [Paracoccaceae bacterium]